MESPQGVPDWHHDSEMLFRTISSQLRTAQEALTAKLYGPDAVTDGDLSPLLQQIDQLRGELSRAGAQGRSRSEGS